MYQLALAIDWNTVQAPPQQYTQAQIVPDVPPTGTFQMPTRQTPTVQASTVQAPTVQTPTPTARTSIRKRITPIRIPVQPQTQMTPPISTMSATAATATTTPQTTAIPAMPSPSKEKKRKKKVIISEQVALDDVEWLKTQQKKNSEGNIALAANSAPVPVDATSAPAVEQGYKGEEVVEPQEIKSSLEGDMAGLDPQMISQTAAQPGLVSVIVASDANDVPIPPSQVIENTTGPALPSSPLKEAHPDRELQPNAGALAVDIPPTQNSDLTEYQSVEQNPKLVGDVQILERDLSADVGMLTCDMVSADDTASAGEAPMIDEGDRLDVLGRAPTPAEDKPVLHAEKDHMDEVKQTVNLPMEETMVCFRPFHLIWVLNVVWTARKIWSCKWITWWNLRTLVLPTLLLCSRESPIEAGSKSTTPVTSIPLDSLPPVPVPELTRYITSDVMVAEESKPCVANINLLDVAGTLIPNREAAHLDTEMSEPSRDAVYDSTELAISITAVDDSTSKPAEATFGGKQWWIVLLAPVSAIFRVAIYSGKCMFCRSWRLVNADWKSHL